ncbi:MAG: TIGR00296 family protein [Candidatus Aenigmatarchaeota archaeon]
MLSEKQTEKVLNYAREVLESYVKDRDLPGLPEDDFFDEKRGVFVTLKKGGQLRGCIGIPRPEMSLGKALRQATCSSSEDYRFSPVQESELEGLRIEVTVLTEPEPIDASDPEEYKEKIEIGKHGLIIERDGRTGLLLPQVPEEQNWDVEEYLQGLCRKARLPPNAWKEDSTEIRRFEGQIIKEGGGFNDH